MSMRRELVAMLTGYYTTESVPDLESTRRAGLEDVSPEAAAQVDQLDATADLPADATSSADPRDVSVTAAERKTRRTRPVGKRRGSRATLSAKDLAPETKDPSPE